MENSLYKQLKSRHVESFNLKHEFSLLISWIKKTKQYKRYVYELLWFESSFTHTLIHVKNSIQFNCSVLYCFCCVLFWMCMSSLKQGINTPCIHIYVSKDNTFRNIKWTVLLLYLCAMLTVHRISQHCWLLVADFGYVLFSLCSVSYTN